MQGKIGLKDVCERAGCSMALVSVVLNGRCGHVHASDATRQRILTAATELGYEPNRAARGLRMSRSFLIGVLAGRLDASFVPEILAGIEHTCLHSSYGVLIGACSNSQELAERWENFKRCGVDGVICIGSPGRYPEYVTADDSVKRVFIGSGSEGQAYGGVWVDRASLLRQAAAAFAERGHVHIGYLALREPEDCEDWRGFLLAHGIVAGPVKRCHDTFDAGVESAGELLASHPELTAIFADSDLLGTAVLFAARQGGREVPRDLAVLGIDDSILCRVCHPALASLRQPRREQGEKATELLMEMIDGKAPRNIVMEGQLVCRASLDGKS